jgi:hypothetical protein
MTALPTPRGWRLPGLRAANRYVVAAFGAVAVGTGLGGLLLGPLRDLGIWLALLAAGAHWLANLWTYGPTAGRDVEARLVTADGQTGLELPYAPVRVWAERAGHAALLLLPAALLLLPDARHVAAWRVGLAGLIVAGVAAWLVAALRGRGSPDPGLVLTPDGVTYAWGRRQWYVPWPAVREVKAYSVHVRGEPTSWYVELRAPDGGVEVTREGRPGAKRARSVTVEVDPLAVDPRVAYWTLRHYVTHAADRPELADTRSVERVRRGDLSS